MDYDKLGLGTAASVITNIEITNWSNKIVITCLFDPAGVNKPYQIVFVGCHGTRWEMIDVEKTEDATADLISISIGEGFYVSPAIICTDIFEVTIQYKEFEVLKSW